MTTLFHRFAKKSTALLALGAAVSGIVMAAARDVGAASPYYGRWTVDEARPVFTPRGREYRTIDIAPCGRDFCGVSVAANGTCGPTLFRFLSSHNDGETQLQGHARWGNQRKNVVINSFDNRRFGLYVGDGYDFGDRSDNMPLFHSDYRRTGGSRCTVR